MSGVNTQGYDKNKLARFLFRRSDFVLAMTGATIGKIGKYIYNTPAYLNQRVLLFKPIPAVNKDFVYYSLLLSRFQKYILNHIDSESAQPNFSARSVSGVFSLINLPEMLRTIIVDFKDLFSRKHIAFPFLQMWPGSLSPQQKLFFGGLCSREL